MTVDKANTSGPGQPAVGVAICTFNRAPKLPPLIRALRAQDSPLPFEIVVVNNNSGDDSLAVLSALAAEPGAPLRYVTEMTQGIVPARNRAVAECIDRHDYVLVMDDDELPRPGWIAAALDALINERADCVGGRVVVKFPGALRPSWVGDELLGFLAHVDHGDGRLWIDSEDTPIWTANVAYRMELFRHGLRFDKRYNREGHAIGGGEDVAMLRTLLSMKARLRYRPDMVVEHYVESWRIKRRYFIKVHYMAGYKAGFWELPEYENSYAGVPPFLLAQLTKQGLKTLTMFLGRHPGVLRQAMNASHALGMIAGAYARRRTGQRLRST